MGRPKAQVDIVADARQFKGGMDEVDQIMKRVGSAMKALAAVAGTVFAVKTIGGWVSGWVEAFGVQEAAVKRLDNALQNSGANVSEWSERLQRSASAIQAVTTHGDEATLALMQYGLSLGNNVENIEAMTKAAYGLADAFGINANDAMKKLTEASTGNYQALAELIPQIRNATNATEAQAMLNEVLASSWEQSKEEAKTSRGQFTQLKNVMGDLGELLGSIFVPYILKAAEALKQVLIWVQANFDPVKSLADDAIGWLIEQFKNLVDTAMWIVSVTISVFANWKESLRAYILSVAHNFVWLFNTIKYYLTEVIPEYAAWFGRNWKEVFKDAFNFIATVVSNAWKNLVDFFKNVWRWLKGEETDWKWTGLTEGFESSLKEDLPKIAERELGETEKWLRNEIAASAGVVWEDARRRYDAMKSWLSAAAEEVEQTTEELAAEAAEVPTVAIGEAVKKETAKAKSAVAPFETVAAAFNRIASAAAKLPGEEASEQTAKNTQKIVSLQEKQVQQNEQVAQGVQSMGERLAEMVDELRTGLVARTV